VSTFGKSSLSQWETSSSKLPLRLLRDKKPFLSKQPDFHIIDEINKKLKYTQDLTDKAVALMKATALHGEARQIHSLVLVHAEDPCQAYRS